MPNKGIRTGYNREQPGSSSMADMLYRIRHHDWQGYQLNPRPRRQTVFGGTRRRYETSTPAPGLPLEITSRRRLLLVEDPRFEVGDTVLACGGMTHVLERHPLGAQHTYSTFRLQCAQSEINLQPVRRELPHDDLAPVTGWIPPGFIEVDERIELLPLAV